MFAITSTILFASLLILQQTFAQEQCGGTLTAKEGVFQTPHYPHEYDSNTHCEWLIEVEADQVVQLTFAELDLDDNYERDNCPTDRVLVYDGDSSSSPALTGRLCGQETPPVMTSTGRHMKISFVAGEDTFGGNGFKATYKSLPAEGNQRCIMNSCGAEITDTSCMIQSPGYPSGYAGNLNCTWTIRAPQGVGNVVFTFTEADFKRKVDGRCSLNNVTLYDGSNIKAPVLHEPSCHTEDNRLKTTVIRSTGPVLIINMRTSAASDIKHGFNGNFVIEGGVSTTTTPPLPMTSTTTTTTTTASTTTPTTTTTTTTTISTTLKQLLSMKTTVGENGKESTSNEPTENPVDNSISHNPAAVSGLVIGCVVAVAIIVFAILLFVAFIHWKRQNHRFNIRLREEDNRSDVNTLISSVDSQEFDHKHRNSKIVKIHEEEEPMFQL
ncbi:neuropilin-1-like isoform X2 [Ciona intestinalis]